jgi:hypothetical protein
MIKREYYFDTIENFLRQNPNNILGQIASNCDFSIEQTQRDAWIFEIKVLQKALLTKSGAIFFEFSIPRMGKRIDVLLIINSIIFILEFKVGEDEFNLSAIDQVWDYALDLKNFHQTSHDKFIVPILVATNAPLTNTLIPFEFSKIKFRTSLM